jgi:hypothetical protein
VALQQGSARVGLHPVEVDVEVVGETPEQDVTHHPVRGAVQPDEHIEGQPFPDDQLLHVLEQGAGVTQQREQLSGEPGTVGAGDADQQRAVRRDTRVQRGHRPSCQTSSSAVDDPVTRRAASPVTRTESPAVSSPTVSTPTLPWAT